VRISRIGTGSSGRFGQEQQTERSMRGVSKLLELLECRAFITLSHTSSFGARRCVVSSSHPARSTAHSRRLGATSTRTTTAPATSFHARCQSAASATRERVGSADKNRDRLRSNYLQIGWSRGQKSWSTLRRIFESMITESAAMPASRRVGAWSVSR
jgi:hypothetical protein